MGILDLLNFNQGEVERPAASAPSVVNLLRSKYNETQINALFGLIEKWGAVDHDLANKFDSSKTTGFSPAVYSKAQKDSAERKLVEQEMLKIIKQDELNVIKDLATVELDNNQLAVAGVTLLSPLNILKGGADTMAALKQSPKPKTDDIAKRLSHADAALTKYSQLIESTIASADNADAKRKEIRDSLQLIIDSEQQRQKGGLLNAFSGVNYETQLRDKQNKFLRTLSGSKDFKEEDYANYPNDAKQADNAEMAHELIERMDKAAVYAAAKGATPPSADLAAKDANSGKDTNNKKDSSADATPKDANSEKATDPKPAATQLTAKFGIAKAGDFADDETPAFYVPKNGSGKIKPGDLIEVTGADGKKLQALAAGKDIADGLGGELSPGLAKALGVKENEPADISYNVVRTGIAEADFKGVTENLIKANKGEAQHYAAGTGAGDTPGGGAAPGAADTQQKSLAQALSALSASDQAQIFSYIREFNQKTTDGDVNGANDVEAYQDLRAKLAAKNVDIAEIDESKGTYFDSAPSHAKAQETVAFAEDGQVTAEELAKSLEGVTAVAESLESTGDTKLEAEQKVDSKALASVDPTKLKFEVAASAVAAK